MNRILPGSISLQDLLGLVNRFLEAEKKLVDAEQAAKNAQAEVDLYRDNLLPNTLRELDVTEYRLGDGRTIKVGMKVQCGVTDDTMPEAEAWLAERNLDGIIKHQLVTEFGKGENKYAEVVAEAITKVLHDLDLPFHKLADKKTIHFQTLAAFVREQMAKGVDIPERPFGLFVTDRVKIENK